MSGTLDLGIDNKTEEERAYSLLRNRSSHIIEDLFISLGSFVRALTLLLEMYVAFGGLPSLQYVSLRRKYVRIWEGYLIRPL